MSSKKQASELSLVRQANIQQLKIDMEVKTNIDFADALGLKRGTLNSILPSPLKGNIGNKICDMIYATIDIPAGWLDIDHSGNGQATVVDGASVQRFITMDDPDVNLTKFPITKFERDAIIKLLFVDKR